MMMKTILALAALAGATIAQYPYDANSSPFRLFVRSSNKTLDGLALAACHEGAAIEGFCLTSLKVNDPPNYSTTFYHATSSSEPFFDTPGILYWNLTISTNQTIPSAMRFEGTPTSNVDLPILMPSNSSYTTVNFCKAGNMYIPRTFDDTVSPPTYLDPADKMQSWYICLTRYGYLYTTLAWKVGVTGEPQNPSCQKVEVVRKF